MKKVLFASTALVATAGVAAADVNLSGSAEIGIVGGDAIETQFHTDIDVNFSMTGETDGGLAFGASVDLDEGGPQAAHNDDTDDGGATFFLAYGNARLDMGDTDGAFDKVMKEVNLVGGSINDAETGHAGFSGNSGLDGTYDGQIATFSYAFDGFTVAASIEQDETGVGDAVFGLGVAYSADLGGTTLGVGLGYQSNDADDIMGVSLHASMGNGFQVGVNYSDSDIGGVGTTHTAIGIGYTAGALGVGVNYGQMDFDAGAIDKQSGMGLAVTYDLGGGLVAQAGYGSSSIDPVVGASTSADAFSIGLAMSF
ncbi:MAG: porin [Rhodobacteraceae bacterium]|nr:porin [Paracoccaceae bacterium]